jgi:hypothetical protein
MRPEAALNSIVIPAKAGMTDKGKAGIHPTPATKNAVLHRPAVPAFIPALSNVDKCHAWQACGRAQEPTAAIRREPQNGGRIGLTFPDI